MSSDLEARGVHAWFTKHHALADISLTFNAGSVTALIGPSGCGKTTLLRIIAGLETPDSGNIILDGVDTADTSVRDRHVGFVFQHYALFKHMTVFDNVAFGLQVKNRHERPSKEEIAHNVHELLKLVQLDWLHDRFPAQLSGGQRQRDRRRRRRQRPDPVRSVHEFPVAGEAPPRSFPRTWHEDARCADQRRSGRGRVRRSGDLGRG